jgi:hypothetical protein
LKNMCRKMLNVNINMNKIRQNYRGFIGATVVVYK